MATIEPCLACMRALEFGQSGCAQHFPHGPVTVAPYPNALDVAALRVRVSELEAELAQANYSKQVAVQEAKAKLESATLLAQAEDEASLTHEGAFLGTPHYASPEQAQREPVTGATDVYALALVMYEALTGEVAHQRPSPYETLTARIGAPLPAHDKIRALDMVLAHEHAHWDGGRWLRSHALFIVRMLQCYHPVALWVFREYCIEVEVGCDAVAVAGRDRKAWLDIIGWTLVALAAGGSLLHGLMRIVIHRRNRRQA